ncbi:MAG TPA: hypothetical protein VMS71_07660, partial [Candidatus Acidoferrum sp.]|nr:hypothetical protein [Candidatus Acidoferrum sp.]
MSLCVLPGLATCFTWCDPAARFVRLKPPPIPADNTHIKGELPMYDTVDQSTNTSFVNFDAQQLIQPQLSHGERIIWAGQPRQGIFLQPQDIFMIPFSFAWGGFAIFWMVAAWKGGAPLPFVMFGLPF